LRPDVKNGIIEMTMIRMLLAFDLPGIQLP